VIGSGEFPVILSSGPDGRCRTSWIRRQAFGSPFRPAIHDGGLPWTLSPDQRARYPRMLGW